jgi:hypothetical protein
MEMIPLGDGIAVFLERHDVVAKGVGNTAALQLLQNIPHMLRWLDSATLLSVWTRRWRFEDFFRPTFLVLEVVWTARIRKCPTLQLVDTAVAFSRLFWTDQFIVRSPKFAIRNTGYTKGGGVILQCRNFEVVSGIYSGCTYYMSPGK